MVFCKRPEVPYYEFGGCHICSLYRNVDNAHQLIAEHRNYRAARYVYEQNYGAIAEGFVVFQTCGNTHCINPAHLKIGTESDCKRQMLEDGRFAIGVRNGRAKLNPDKVREIRQSNEGHKALARQYGVDAKLIRMVLAGKIWQSVK
jgi:hypothetical protein